MIPVTSEDMRLMMEAGYLYLSMYRFKEAQEVFEGVTVLVPNSDVPLVALGNVFCVQGKFNDAIKTYERALKVVPQSPFATSYLGEAYFFMGAKEQALQYLKEASRLDPKGKSGDFARSLLDLIGQGFVPDPKIVKEQQAKLGRR